MTRTDKEIRKEIRRARGIYIASLRSTEGPYVSRGHGIYEQTDDKATERLREAMATTLHSFCDALLARFDD